MKTSIFLLSIIILSGCDSGQKNITSSNNQPQDSPVSEIPDTSNTDPTNSSTSSAAPADEEVANTGEDVSDNSNNSDEEASDSQNNETDTTNSSTPGNDENSSEDDASETEVATESELDSDSDDITDNEDYCPNIDSEKNMGTKGKASIIFFNFDNSYFQNLFQETIRLSRAFDGYDYKILLYDTNETFSAKISSAQAIHDADELYYPSYDHLKKAIRNAVSNGYMVDIWIFSHGGVQHVSSIGGDNLIGFLKLKDNKEINSQDILRDFSPEKTGCRTLPIRLVYSTACYGQILNEAWENVGAKITVGSRSVNFYPTQFGKFAKEWSNGYSVAKAQNDSNTSVSRTVVQSYIEAEAIVTVSKKGDCSLIPNVLGKTDCAEWYFTNTDTPYGYYIDAIGEIYRSDWSGTENMNYSSEKILKGDSDLTIDSEPEW